MGRRGRRRRRVAAAARAAARARDHARAGPRDQQARLDLRHRGEQPHVLRPGQPDLRTAIPIAVVALVGSFAGASIAATIPAAAFKPIIVVALVAVAAVTLARPTLGAELALRHQGAKHYGTAVAIGALLGLYDGVLGPGTGTFLVIALVTALGYDFLQASAKAKIVNFATNLGALLFFIPHGSVFWGLGLILAAANVLGSRIGAGMAVERGSRFIRIAFLVVVFALILKLGADVWGENVQPLL